MKRETFDSSRDRFEADFIVNKLVIERERRENYLENWRGISFRRNLRIVEYGLNFHISSLVTRLSYLSASNSLIIIILEIPTDNTIILFREFLPLLFFVNRETLLQLYCVYGSSRLDEFYIGGSLQRVSRVSYAFTILSSSSMEKHMTMSWEKKKNGERRKEEGEGGKKKRNVKRIVRKKGGGGVWAITTWLELQRTPSLLGIPLDPVTKGNDPRFLASKPRPSRFSSRLFNISPLPCMTLHIVYYV